MNNGQFLLVWGVFQQPKNNVLVTASAHGSFECKTPIRKKTPCFSCPNQTEIHPTHITKNKQKQSIKDPFQYQYLSVFKALAKKSMFLPKLAVAKL